MNYLAHAYLSFNDPEVLVGNMISDFVKGKTKFDFPAGIQKGITLHRSIDHFTDFHPVTAEAKSFFRPAYRLYAGAFVDVVYDHFLARSIKEYLLKDFTTHTYSILQKYFDILPERFRKMFPYMQQENWLYNYRFESGTEKSFRGLVRRAKYLDNELPAVEIFHQHYDQLQQCFNDFYPSLSKFAAVEFEKMISL